MAERRRPVGPTRGAGRDATPSANGHRPSSRRNRTEPRKLGPFQKPRGVVYATITGILALLLLITLIQAARQGPPTPAAASPSASPAASASAVPTVVSRNYSAPPPMTIDTTRTYTATMVTDKGTIVLELDPKLAPVTVNNFVFLAKHDFYNGLTFHRVVPGFVIQGGDPTATGGGGPGYTFADEPVKGQYTQGCLAMANSGPNTNGSQFFICTANDTSLPPKYNLFGRVTKGMDVALKIQVGDHIKSVTIS